VEAFLLTSVSGFFAAYLLLFTVCLPYLSRHSVTSAGQLQGMGLHYCVGYLIFGVLLLHMFVSMLAGMARGASLTGLNLATLALVLVMIQVMLGMTLMAGGRKSRPLKALHLSLMLGIVALAVLHVALNSALLRGLLG
jgi:hypothetical protein